MQKRSVGENGGDVSLTLELQPSPGTFAQLCDSAGGLCGELLCALSSLTGPVRSVYLNLYCQGFWAGGLAHAGEAEA